MDSIREATRLFQQGGLVMYPLLLCSVCVVAIVLERWRYYRRNNRQAPGFFENLQDKISNADWTGAAKICEQSPGVVARVLAAGLRFRGDTTNMKEAFESVTAWESAQLRKQLGYLDTIVTLAPLLGLLGTVLGMIGSFSVLNVNNSNPVAITGGVGEALVATATGLCVAVLALVSHSYFCHRLDALITEIERSCTFIIENVKGEQE
ncbi:MotA/TolQ/ExbB proton channel family protein [Sporomusa acidovorans]|uniref:Tol-Pal system protein TolQ n=1 Tax=Sporomusa acidovorans (strain ATCC 49682 / DSM 3132 / Mol) TaxID=1123286 RepID=A0ABZ3J927_SPOA4|nr:MotA/TolQ/ExbB proton channel family protein [Sporomusa acidovorans]OZC17362.1 biopolymer transport protein ExbB [Sporomusa acidovorans DSM 3132]SDF46085.1 biopolymer transport protein ExbB [Sporomusa acidovorans]